jgi:hypothetical protein
MSVIIISAMFSWKEGVDATNVGAAHKALAEFAGAIPGVRLCRYGINEDSRTSGVFAVYDSPEALQALFDALVTRGGDIMAAELAVTELIPGETFIQGSRESLEELETVIDAWGLQRLHTDSQGSAHVAI